MNIVRSNINFERNLESVQISDKRYELEVTEQQAPAQEVRGFFIRYWPHSEDKRNVNESLKIGTLFILRNGNGDIVGLSQVSDQDLSFFLVHPDLRNCGIATFLADRGAAYAHVNAKRQKNSKPRKPNVLETTAVTPEGLGLALLLRERFRGKYRLIISKWTETSKEMESLVGCSPLLESPDIASIRHRMAMDSSKKFMRTFEQYRRKLLIAMAKETAKDPSEEVQNNVGRYMLQAAFCADGKRWDLCRENIEKALLIIHQNPDTFMECQREVLDEFLPLIPEVVPDK